MGNVVTSPVASREVGKTPHDVDPIIRPSSAIQMIRFLIKDHLLGGKTI